MQRRAVILGAACIALGAGSTVLTAWALQLYYLRAPGKPMPAAYLVEGERVWHVQQWGGLGRHGYTLLPTPRGFPLSIGGPVGAPPISTTTRARLLDPRVDVPAWAPRPDLGKGISHLAVGVYGWPMPALQGEVVLFVNATSRLRGAWPIVPRSWHRRPYAAGLNLWPVWPAFAVNTAVFASLWGAALVAAPAARRRGRRGAGRCVACGYDLRGQAAAGCPECGQGRGTIGEVSAGATRAGGG